MARLRTSCFIHRHRHSSSFAATAIKVSAAMAATLVAAGQADAQVCGPQHGGAVIICGQNGGTSSQISSPGSVIIMRQETSAFPGDLPDSALPEEAAAARRGMSFLENSFRAGEVTGFVTGFGASRDQDETDVERGYSADRRGIVAGMRIERPGYALFFGLDLSREDQDYDPDNLGATAPNRRPILVPPASIDREDVGISLGASVDLQPGLVWHGAARFGLVDISTERASYDLCSKDGFPDNCENYPDNIKDTFLGRGSTDGTSIALQTGLSYGRSLGSGFHGGLSGSLLYVREKFDGFTEYVDETLPDGTDEGFSFGSDTRKSLVSRIGVEVARPTRVSGAMIVPSLRAAWLHEFSDDSRTIAVHAPDAFTGDGFEFPEDFTIRTSDPDRNYFTVGASVGALFAEGRGSLALDYEAIAGHDFIDEHIVSLRLGYRF